MADVAFTTFDGVAVNGTSSIGLAVRSGSSPDAQVSVSASERRNAAGVFEQLSLDPLELELVVYPRNSTTPYEEWKQLVEGLFQPWTSNTPRMLLGTLQDGSGTQVYLEVLVTRRQKVADTGSLTSVAYQVELLAQFPVWRATATSSSTGNPSVSGNTPAAAVLELTTATHKQIRRCDVAGAGAGGGLMGYPVRLAYTQAGIDGGEAFAMVNGSNTPTYSDNYAAYLWTVLDTSQDGSQETVLDLLTIDGVATSNPLGGRLEQGGMKLGDAAAGTDCTNILWAWNSFEISQNPIRCGSWRPAVTGADYVGSFQLDTESVAGVTFLAYSDSPGLKRNADSMAMVIGAQGNSLSSLIRVTTGHDVDGEIRSYCRVRAFGSAQWATVWTTMANATFSTALSLSNGVEVAVGIEAFTSTGFAFNGSLALSGSGSVYTLSLNGTPTINVGAAENADYFHGTISNAATGEAIECRDVVVRDGTLIIDSLGRLISSSVGDMEPIYGEVRVTNDDNWFLLLPGGNVITNGITGASYTARWQEAWA